MGQRGVSSIGRIPAAERRRKVARAIAICEGNVKRAAHFLGIHRSHMYRLVNTHRLHPLILAARRKRALAETKARRFDSYGFSSD